MGNPFYRPPIQSQNGSGNQFLQRLNQFKQFRQSFTGDPKAEVDKLVASGKMSQEQLNALIEQANQLKSLLS